MRIRDEQPSDFAAIHALNARTFPTDAEARLVDALREAADPVVSLVAEQDRTLIGHIMFTPVTLDENPALRLMGLAPMAVAEAYQRSGVGSALVREGLERCRALGAQAVVVLGHSSYYPKFGFLSSVSFGIKSEYDVDSEVFMAMELQPGALAQVSGTVRYHPAFATI